MNSKNILTRICDLIYKLVSFFSPLSGEFRRVYKHPEFPTLVFRNLLQVPSSNCCLALIIISSHVIRVVGNVAGVVLIQEAEWSVVDSDASQAHVVSVEDTMREPHC